MNIGGTTIVDGVSFTMTPAVHSSWIEEAGTGFYGGTAAGFVIGMDGVKIYHAGDTALFSDMKLIGELYHPGCRTAPDWRAVHDGHCRSDDGSKFYRGKDRHPDPFQYVGQDRCGS
ncbi:MAG: MBL fold metallo-hydrolase [Bacillus subtilis]|nr:MBL fold metallo-hydrolase [Bacillus subtilis]